MIGEQQYGFMHIACTINAMFPLRVLMEKYKDQKELNCVFVDVDLEKPYNKVPREILWYCTKKSGVAEKYVRIAQNIYKDSETVARFVIGVADGFMVGEGLHHCLQ